MNEMIVRSVAGWSLCSRDGGDWWIRDVELAHRAGLVRPTQIRRTIRAAIDEGAVSAEINGALGERAVVLAENTLVPIPGPRGGHQEVTEYLLNRKAAVLIAMRLRTERAAELVDAVVTVFLRVVDGQLTGEELRALREDRAAVGAELALLKAQVVELKNASLLGSGIITPPQERAIKSQKRRIAEKRIAASLNPTISSANAAIQNAMKTALEWGGNGQRLGYLPSALYPRARALLDALETEVDKYLRGRTAQSAIPGFGNVVPLKRRRRR